MRARYIGTGYGNWKGVNISPGVEFDVPEHLREMVAINANFEVLEGEAPKRRGRPPKVRDGDDA